MTIAEEFTAWPAVSPPTSAEGSGFTFKWNMGWMHDTLDYMSKAPIFRRYHHQRDDLRCLVRLGEEFHPAAIPRRGGAPQGVADRQDAGRPRGSASPTCARCSAGCGRTPARSCSSWAASSPSGRNGTTTARLDWHLLESPNTPACSASSPTSATSTRHPGAVGGGRQQRGLPLDRRRQRRPERGELRANGRAAAIPAQPASPTSRPPCTRASASGCRALAHGARSSTPTPATTAAAASAHGRVETEPRSWHGFEQSALMTVPPLAVVWLAPEE